MHITKQIFKFFTAVILCLCALCCICMADGENPQDNTKTIVFTKTEIANMYHGEASSYIEPDKDVIVVVPVSVEKEMLMTSVYVKDDEAYFRVVGIGVNHESKVSDIYYKGWKFLWHGILTLIKWLIIIVIGVIMLISLGYSIAVIKSAAFSDKKSAERKERRKSEIREKINKTYEE